MLNPTPQRLRRGTRSPTTDPPQHSPRTWTTFFLPRALGGVSEARTPTSSSSAAQGPWGHIWGGERSHQHPPTPRHGGSITSDSPSPPRPGPTCRTPRSPPLPQSQCAHLPFWQRCGVRAERPAGTPRLCSAELRFTRSVTAGMNISWHALRDGSRELFMAHLETELMAREWAAARPPPG